MKGEVICCLRLIEVYDKHGMLQKESTTVAIRKEQ